MLLNIQGNAILGLLEFYFQLKAPILRKLMCKFSLNSLQLGLNSLQCYTVKCIITSKVNYRLLIL